MLASFFVPGGPAASGWTAYATLSAKASLHGRRLGSESLDYQFDYPRCLVSDGVDQLHYDHCQYESARHDLLSHAAHRLVAFHHRDPVIACPAGADGGFGDVALRPHAWNQLLFAGRRRRAAALAAYVLVLWSPGGLCPGASSDGSDFGVAVDFFPQTDFRLSRHGFFHDRHRLSLVDRLGPPHVHQRHESPAWARPS